MKMKKGGNKTQEGIERVGCWSSSSMGSQDGRCHQAELNSPNREEGDDGRLPWFLSIADGVSFYSETAPACCEAGAFAGEDIMLGTIFNVPDYDENYCPKGYVKTEDGMVCREGYLSLGADEKRAICNGIGAASGLSKHLPDTIWGLDCGECGNIHDHGYHVGGTEEDRETDDKVFLHNLRTKIKGGAWLLRHWRNRRAVVYYKALRVGGSIHYNTSGLS